MPNTLAVSGPIRLASRVVATGARATHSSAPRSVVPPVVRGLPARSHWLAGRLPASIVGEVATGCRLAGGVPKIPTKDAPKVSGSQGTPTVMTLWSTVTAVANRPTAPARMLLVTLPVVV